MAGEDRIDCLIPGLRASFAFGRFARAPALPDLALLLARGHILAGVREAMEARACRLCGLAPDARGELPFAALGWLGETGQRPDTPLLRADPVHLRADQTQPRLFHAEQLGIRRAEADALVETLNAHFAEDGIAIAAPDPRRWYARLPAPARIRTTPLALVNGQPIGAALPAGEDERLWRRRLNEAQMLLHDHPVNRDRREQGLPPVNGVWFWGGGELPAHLDTDYAEVASDNAVVAGLARLAGVPLAHVYRAGGAGHRLWTVELLAPWAAYGDSRTWLDRLTQLEPDLFGTLARALRAGRRRVTLYTGSGVDYRVRTRDLRRFWRRRRSPLDLLAETVR